LKDQYFGDVNDYRKYGLLRALQAASGLKLGVCWLRTANDSRPDGEFRDYLRTPERFRVHDPALFDALTRLLHSGASRSVELAEAWDLLSGAAYHHDVLGDDALDRLRYFATARERLATCPLLFFDPDNGIEVGSVGYGRKGSAKYVYWRELEDAVRRGHSIVVYQHFRRERRDHFLHRLAGELHRRLGAGRVLAFRTAHVVFFLVARPEHVPLFSSAPDLIQRRWAGQIVAVDSSVPP
jgi:hypothetical protein